MWSQVGGRFCRPPLPAHTASWRVALLAGGGSPHISAASCISSPAAKSVRKKKFRGRFKGQVPPNLLRNAGDGDFPIALRPYRPTVIQDLQDSSLDAAAATEGVGHVRRLKPHEVREAVRGSVSPDPGPEDKTRYGSLKDQRALISQVPAFDFEKDLKEGDAADLHASRARAQAARNFKHMPNPFGKKPGVLGTSPEAESKYYSQYFNGEGSKEDPRARSSAEEGLTEGRVPRPKRERISPKKYWYQDDYVTPDPRNVAYMRSKDLKFAMMNEAHLVRKWRNDQPEGRAAGLPAGSEDLWMVFGYRAAELAAGPVPDAPDVPPPERRRGPKQRCSLATTLRFLQAHASVQAGPYTALQRLVSRLLSELDQLKPLECFYVLQALGRLRYRHPKSVQLLKRLSLTWRTLQEKQFVKAANAVGKLDLAGNMWARHLKAALAGSLPRMSGRHLARLKAITVMELLDEPESLVAYLEECERKRQFIWYSRHLQMVEIHTHLVYPDVWEGLSEHVREFLQEVRDASEESRKEEVQSKRGRRGRRRRGRSSELAADVSDESGTDEDTDSDDEGRPKFNKNLYSSALHADVSRVLLRKLGVEHQNKLAAGPLTLDMVHTPTMTVVEAAEQWQFYLRSPQVTAQARRRHEILRTMGFKLVLVPYHRWGALEDDAAKEAFLHSLVPKSILPPEAKEAATE